MKRKSQAVKPGVVVGGIIGESLEELTIGVEVDIFVVIEELIVGILVCGAGVTVTQTILLTVSPSASLTTIVKL